MNNIRVRGVTIFNATFVRKKSYFTERFNKKLVSLPVNNKFIFNNVVQSPNYSFARYSDTSGPHKNEIAKQKLTKYLEDPANLKQYKILQLEVEVMRQNGENVPDLLLERHWLELTLLDSRSKRRRYLDFIFGLEKKKEHQMEKKRQKREELEEYKANNPNKDLPDHMNYKLGGNSPFLRFRESLINKFYNWRLFQAMMYGRHVILDCGYEDQMTRNETKNCAKQLQLAFAANRVHNQPLYMHYCNYNFDGLLHEEMISFVPTMLDVDFPLTVTRKSYLDCFDRNFLVYLTPDCHVDIDLTDLNAIYIVGAIVDKVSGQPLSLARAKKDGIRMARLPIDNHLHFGSGSNKTLTINQMIEILCDALHTHDWDYSLRHVPRRKLFESRQTMIKNKINKFLLRTESKSTNVLQDFSMNSRNKFRIK